ncbi:MAG: hypothetical protein ABWX84_12870 [Nocardioides sp.]
MAPGELLLDAVDRQVLAGHEGKSGAGLERVRLGDGRALVVKRLTTETDLMLAVTGGSVGWEHTLWRSGALDRLPPHVGHAIVDTWVEGETTVIAMRDLGEDVLTWARHLDASECRWMLERVAALHRRFLHHPPEGLVPLGRLLSLFSPARLAAAPDSDNDLVSLALRGWEMFEDSVPADVAGPVLDLLADVRPLGAALEERPCTLVHGDLATVNMAFRGDDLLLLDWGMPSAAPGAVDIARFVAGCSSVVAMTREELLATYRRAAGPAYDETAMGLGLLSGLVWLGWNKALDATENPDPEIRVRERADLDWWVREARTTLESGALRWT